MHLSFSETSDNIDISHILLKLESLDYVADSMDLSSTIPKPAEFFRLTQNNGHYIVQRHSRAPILVPIESPYVTSY